MQSVRLWGTEIIRRAMREESRPRSGPGGETLRRLSENQRAISAASTPFARPAIVRRAVRHRRQITRRERVCPARERQREASLPSPFVSLELESVDSPRRDPQHQLRSSESFLSGIVFPRRSRGDSIDMLNIEKTHSAKGRSRQR